MANELFLTQTNQDFFDPKVVATIDVSHLRTAFSNLFQLAAIVENNPDNFCNVANMMAHISSQIRVGMNIPKPDHE